jgi:hypothetical protein
MEKTSYKNVVLVEQPTETKQSKESLCIVGYENIINSLQEIKEQAQTNTSRKNNNSKKELMIDVLNDMSNVTGYVNEYYGFHGIGDELKLEDVMNSLDKSVKVEVISDNDYDNESGEEEL